MQGNRVDCLIMQFRDVVTAYSSEGSKEQRFDAMSAILGNQTERLLAECETQLAYADNNYLPFLLPLYKFKRSLLLDCLSELELRSSSRDHNVEYAIHFLLSHRSYHRTYLELPLQKSNHAFDLSWIPEKWFKLVTGKNKREPLPSIKTVHRKYFEICLLTQVMLYLRSGNLYVQESEQFNDYRRQLISWEEYENQISYYEVQAGIQTNPARFVNALREKIEMSALMLDKAFPDNTYIRIENNSLIIKKAVAKEIPHQLRIIDKLITERMPKTNVLDILIDTEKWLNLSCDFQPLSGFQPKISHYQERFITTLFCYGFNFGPMQTARAIKGISRKQVAWLNLRHVTEEKLDKAIIKVINAYNQFLLPKYWGTGDHVAADGTKWDIYEQNLLSQFHVRYGGYGGIGYYHVSDLYIALFSRFIPCGVYEGIHILDPLVKLPFLVQCISRN